MKPGARAAISRAVSGSIGPYPSRWPGSSEWPRSVITGTVTCTEPRIPLPTPEAVTPSRMRSSKTSARSCVNARVSFGPCRLIPITVRRSYPAFTFSAESNQYSDAIPSGSGSKTTVRSATDFWCRAVIDSGCCRSRMTRALYFRLATVRCGADFNSASSNPASASAGSDQAWFMIACACRYVIDPSCSAARVAGSSFIRVWLSAIRVSVERTGSRRVHASSVTNSRLATMAASHRARGTPAVTPDMAGGPSRALSLAAWTASRARASANRRA